MKSSEDNLILSESALFLENERDEVVSYLQNWKKFTLRNIQRDFFFYIVLNEEWSEISATYSDILNVCHQLCLKLEVRTDKLYTFSNEIKI